MKKSEKVEKISTWHSVNISVRLAYRSRISRDGGRGMGAVERGGEITLKGYHTYS